MRKCILFFAVSILGLWVSSADVFAFDPKGGQECIKCHTLNADSAKEVLSGVIPDIRIIEVLQAPISGMWEIAFEAGGKKSLIYIDYSKKKVFLGNILDLASRKNYTKERFDQINKLDLSAFPFENALVMGDKDAKYRVVVFDDPD